jgi:hypothetical protein
MVAIIAEERGRKRALRGFPRIDHSRRVGLGDAFPVPPVPVGVVALSAGLETRGSVGAPAPHNQSAKSAAT